MRRSSSAVAAAAEASEPNEAQEDDTPHGAHLVYEIFIGAHAIFVLGLNIVEWLIPDDMPGKLGRLNVALQGVILQGDTLVCALFFVDFLIKHITPFMLRGKRRLIPSSGNLSKFGKMLVPCLDLISCLPRRAGVGGNFWRAYRLVQLVRVLKAAKVLGDVLCEFRVLSVVFITSFLSFASWILGAIAVLAFEIEGHKATIRTAGDALWWSLSTMTTVGYGDMAPVTVGGRIVAMLLMLVGVSIFGTASGLISSFVRSGAKPTVDERAAPGADQLLLAEELKELRAELAELRKVVQQHSRSDTHPEMSSSSQ